MHLYINFPTPSRRHRHATFTLGLRRFSRQLFPYLMHGVFCALVFLISQEGCNTIYWCYLKPCFRPFYHGALAWSKDLMVVAGMAFPRVGCWTRNLEMVSIIGTRRSGTTCVSQIYTVLVWPLLFRLLFLRCERHRLLANPLISSCSWLGSL